MATATEAGVKEISFDDYMAMPTSNLPMEVVGGVLIVMPLPTCRHQRISLNILRPLDERASEFGLVVPPVDLVIRKAPKLWTRQPDALFFSDRKAGFSTKADPDRLFRDCHAPDLAVEILSPGQDERTLAEKLGDYAAIGIDEVWFVDREAREVRVLSLIGSAYAISGTFGIGDRVVSGVLPGIDLDVAAIFE